jgi:hypothetical protein
VTYGTVEFTLKGAKVIATLRDDRTWAVACPDPEVRDFVRIDLDAIAQAPHGPADGFYGPRQLREAAELFGGTFTIEPREESPPGRIY